MGADESTDSDAAPALEQRSTLFSPSVTGRGSLVPISLRGGVAGPGRDRPTDWILAFSWSVTAM